ncbi:hypothetical protein ACFV5M_12025 [Streptomyces albidoflavus]
MDAGTDTRDPWTPAAGVQAADRRPCDLVTVPARQGLEAVDILRRGAEPAVGPVLLVGRCDTLGFLVPPGTADRWDVPGSACTTAGRRPGGAPGRGPRAARAGGRAAGRWAWLGPSQPP